MNTYRTEEMDDPTTPTKVNPRMSLEACLSAFRFLLGEVVRHKAKPDLDWVVTCRKLVETDAGIGRVYSCRVVTMDMGDTGPVHGQVADYYEYELLDGLQDHNEE